jgi:hypothetical protein
MKRLSMGPGLWVGLGLVSVATAMAVTAATPPPPSGHAHMEVAPAAKKLHAELERVTQAAAKQGNYTCCIAPPCEFCAVHMAHCPCGKNLAAGKPVCRECKGGWDVGEGRIAGVKAANVKGMSTREAMKMHELHHAGPGEKAGGGR